MSYIISTGDLSNYSVAILLKKLMELIKICKLIIADNKFFSKIYSSLNVGCHCFYY